MVSWFFEYNNLRHRGKKIKARLFTVRFFLTVRYGLVRFNRQVYRNRTEPYGCDSNKTAPHRTAPHRVGF